MEVRVTLTVVDGPDEGLSVRLERQRSVIGRQDCELVLRDRKVSHHHAAIEIAEGEVTIVDLESRNGVAVNGKTVTRARLSNLDEIRVGLTKIKVLMVEDLEAFRSRNLPVEKKPKESPGRDIGSMIDDELKQFSKWDLGSGRASGAERDLVWRGFLLEILEGPDAGRRIRLEKQVTTLGRGKADIAFRDSDVSRVHAAIDIVGKANAVIRDLESTNGVYVNKKKVTEARLVHGDRIQIGGTLCRFVVED